MSYTRYDRFAAAYDAHFNRPVDKWEDDWLASLLRPHVNGYRVLDLGCGTGWVMDHCNPAEYTGVDTSMPMLEVLSEKHRKATGCLIDVGAGEWQHHLPQGQWDCITATWSLEYLGDLAVLLATARGLLAPGGCLALHGSLPRGHRREHFSVKAVPYRPISPASVEAASKTVFGRKPLITGTSMLPDKLAHLGHATWLRALAAPAGLHYACLWRWWPDGR